MYKLSREHLRFLVARWGEEPAARALSRLGFTPNVVTSVGFALACLSGYLVAIDQLVFAGVSLVFSGVLDMLDGSLARLTEKDSKSGALLDSVLDRLGESALLLGILLLGLQQEKHGLVVLVFLSLCGSFMVSYIRARSEGLGLKATVGLATRPERLVILCIGLLSGFVFVSMVLLVAVSFGTAIHRLFYSFRRVSKLE